MPARSKGARLWLRPSRTEDGRHERATWIICDGKHQQSTGCALDDHREAQRRLARYIASKDAPPRRERDIAEIPVADVINLYLADVSQGQAHPHKAAERAGRLVEFFGSMMLGEITGPKCRAYAAWREGRGRSNKGTGGGARRDLQDLAAAINHHAREGLHRGQVRVALPPKGEARQRWLTRAEAARLLRVCLHTPEVQNGTSTEKRPLRHLGRFLLFGIYTGSRPGAILNGSWMVGPRRSFIDLANGVFHRRGDGVAETTKRQPTVRLAPRLLAHLNRWRRLDEAEGHTMVVTFDGHPVASVKTALTRACKLAELDAGVTAYTLRHSAASWLVMKGISTRKIADFLGTSEPMILKHYGHLAPDYQAEAANAIGRK